MMGWEAFEARYSPGRSILLGLLSFGFVALGLWLIGTFGEPPTDSRHAPDWMIPIIGWVCIIFFGPVGLFHLSKAFSPGLSVRVDQRGMLISDYSSETIPWEDFTAMGWQNIMGTKLLVFDVVPERRETFSAFRRIMWSLNEPFNGKGGSLVMNNTDRSHGELIDAVIHFAPPILTQWMR